MKLTVMVVFLHCCIFTAVRGVPVADKPHIYIPVELERYYQEGEDIDEDYDIYELEDEKPNAVNKEYTEGKVLLLSAQTGKLIVARENGLRSNGGKLNDPAAQFVSTSVSYNSITLTTHDHKLLGINKKGQIVLDARNSSKIAHNFETVMSEEGNSITPLQVHIGDSDCYLAFTKEGYPVENACAFNRESPETYISILKKP